MVEINLYYMYNNKYLQSCKTIFIYINLLLINYAYQKCTSVSISHCLLIFSNHAHFTQSVQARVKVKICLNKQTGSHKRRYNNFPQPLLLPLNNFL